MSKNENLTPRRASYASNRDKLGSKSSLYQSTSSLHASEQVREAVNHYFKELVHFGVEGDPQNLNFFDKHTAHADGVHYSMVAPLKRGNYKKLVSLKVPPKHSVLYPLIVRQKLIYIKWANKTWEVNFTISDFIVILCIAPNNFSGFWL